MAWPATQALAQGTPGMPSIATPGALPSQTIGDVNPSPDEIAIIKGYVQREVQQLSAAASMKEARNHLVNSSTTTSPPGPSAAFSQTYDQALNDQFKILYPTANAEVRLNIAVVVAKASANAKLASVANAALEPIIIDLIGDKDDSVCLWGMKAAGNILPALAPNSALLNAVVPAAAAHHFKGCIVDEAYQALDPDPGGGAVVQPGLIAPLIDLYGQRVALYVQNLPDTVSIDASASLFLTSSRTWPFLNKQQQTQAMQLMQDLISLCSQRILQSSTTAEQSTELTYLVTKTAAALIVVGDNTGNGNLKDQATKLSHDAAPQIAGDLPQLQAAIKGAFGVKDPPTLAPAPPPGGGSPPEGESPDSTH